MRRLDKNEFMQSVQLPSDINTSTIELIYLLNKLANRTEIGFIPFSQVTEDSDRNLIAYVDKEEYGEPLGTIVADMCVLDDDCHHDIISTFNDLIDGVTFVFCPYDEEDVSILKRDGYISVKITDWKNEIAIEDGEWEVLFN